MLIKHTICCSLYLLLREFEVAKYNEAFALSSFTIYLLPNFFDSHLAATISTTVEIVNVLSF